MNAGSFRRKNDRSVRLVDDFLGGMPLPFFDVHGRFRGKPDFHPGHSAMEHSEAGLEITVDLKIVRGLEKLIRHGNVPDPVTGKCPDLFAQKAMAGHVEGVVVKPDVIRCHPALGGGLPADREIGNIDAFFFIDRRVDFVYDFVHIRIMLVRLLPDPEIGFKPFKKGLVVLRKGFFDLAGQGFQGIMKNRVLEDIQKIPAKIQGCQLGHGQGHGDAFPGFQHEPQAFAVFLMEASWLSYFC